MAYDLEFLGESSERWNRSAKGPKRQKADSTIEKVMIVASVIAWCLTAHEALATPQ